MGSEHEPRCIHEANEAKVVKALEALGGVAVTADLLEELRDHHGVPAVDAKVAIMDAEDNGRVVWNRVEHYVKLAKQAASDE